MKQGEQTKRKIVRLCNDLFYQNGYHQTAFSDIVNATNMSKGNLTYHFKSKQAILIAVFELRKTQIENTLALWDSEYSDASSRLNRFIKSLITGRKKIIKYGCPNGSISYELGKSTNGSDQLSKAIFDIIQIWLRSQFSALGYSKKQSKNKALELYTRAQGISMIAHAYRDESLFEDQINLLTKLIHPPG